MRIVRYAILLLLMGIPCGIVARGIYLDGYYYNHAPRREDAANGAVVRTSVHHGATVYLTPGQWMWFYSPTSIGVQSVLSLGAAAIAVSLNRKWKVFGAADAA
jgi:hypothetical protein